MSTKNFSRSETPDNIVFSASSIGKHWVKKDAPILEEDSAFHIVMNMAQNDKNFPKYLPWLKSCTLNFQIFKDNDVSNGTRTQLFG